MSFRPSRDAGTLPHLSQAARQDDNALKSRRARFKGRSAASSTPFQASEQIAAPASNMLECLSQCLPVLENVAPGSEDFCRAADHRLVCMEQAKQCFLACSREHTCSLSCDFDRPKRSPCWPVILNSSCQAGGEDPPVPRGQRDPH